MSTDAKRVYEDEKTYVNREMWDEVLSDDREPEVIPHNTLRFDVHLAYVYTFLDEGMVTKEKIATAIRGAIIQAVDNTLGTGHDGVPIPGGATVRKAVHSVMLHRESISFDLS